jgi:hypothetical protein
MPPTLVVKLAPEDDDIRRRQSALGIYESETGFYADLAGDGTLPAPRCWFAAYEPGDGHFAILMEDLGDGWVGRDDVGLSPAEALGVARALGRLHARWWQVGRPRHTPWLRDWSQRMIGLAQRLAGAAPRARAHFRDDIDGRLVGLIDELPERLPSLPSTLSSGDVTLAHGDIQPRNIIFSGSPDSPDVTLIDWSSVMWGPGALDICNLLSICLEPQQRRDTETLLIRTYLQELAPITDFSYEDVLADYHRLLLYRLARTLTVGGIAGAGSDLDEMTRRNLRRLCVAMVDSGWA